MDILAVRLPLELLHLSIEPIHHIFTSHLLAKGRAASRDRVIAVHGLAPQELAPQEAIPGIT